MTREKLEKEAIAKYKIGSYPQLHPDHYAFIHGYLAAAEPREKRIEELEEICQDLSDKFNFQVKQVMKLEEENKKLKECLTVGTTWNKALNSMNKTLEEERDKYRNMVFDKGEQLAKAKEIITNLVTFDGNYKDDEEYQRTSELYDKIWEEAEQFLKEADE